MSRTERDRRSRKGPPIIVKLMSWLIVIGLSVGAGYWLAGNIIEKKFLGNGTGQITPEDEKNKPQNSGDKTTAVATPIPINGVITVVQRTYYLPTPDGLTAVKVDVEPGNMESESKIVFDSLFSESQNKGYINAAPKVLHVFRTGEYMYLNISQDMASVLKPMDAKTAEMFISAIVKTAVDSFPPVKQVTFLIGGREIPRKQYSVDLSQPWQLANEG